MRIYRLALLLVVVLTGLLAFPRGALARDGLPASEIEARKRTLRTLSPEDRQALKSALERFRKLSPEQREKLRKKAGK